tara:strand:+ start:248 stop:457 length:210 start_codon:yes stop_codon:yes gene_type:complete
LHKTVTLKETILSMARKTDEELKLELQAIEKRFNDNMQEQRNLQDRAIAINAILQERDEAANEKKSSAK